MTEHIPNNAIILKFLRGRTKQQIEEKLRNFGNITICKTMSLLDLAIIVFESSQSAINAKEQLFDEVIEFAQSSDVERILHDQLEVPVLEHNYLISPPPSPPQEWTPIHEEINNSTVADLEPHLDSQQQNTMLLDATPTTPQIIVEGTEILSKLTRTSSNKIQINKNQ